MPEDGGTTRPPRARGGEGRADHLETARLVLRPFEPGDLDAMAATLGDPVSMRFYPHPFSRVEAGAWVERNLERFEADGLGLWAVVRRDTGETIGDCGAVWQEVDGLRELELGWHLHPAQQGLGYATEAAHAWREHALRSSDRPYLISIILAENTASRHVAERIGMTVWKSAEFAGRQHLVYRVAR
jgi:ribosomal-protein-alanine N-acetyltransferase